MDLCWIYSVCYSVGMRKLWWLLPVLIVLIYPRESFAKAGDACDKASDPTKYICVENHLVGDRAKSPSQTVTLGTFNSGQTGGNLWMTKDKNGNLEVKLFADACDPNQTCVEKFAPDGLLGGKCIDPLAKVNTLSKQLGNNASATISSNDISKKCLLFSFICPSDIFSSFIQGASSSVTSLTGINNDATIAALSCSRGYPSTYNPDTEKLDKTKQCMCLDPAPLASSGIKLLCARYASGLPEAALTGQWFGSKVLDDVLNVSVPFIAINTLKAPPLSIDAEIDNKLTKMIQMISEPSTKEKATRSIHAFAGCLTCANRGGYYSAIGCLPINDLGSFVTTLAFQIGLGLAGAFCILCMIYSAIIMQTSGGNSEAIGNAQKTLMSCLSGLVLIIFSVFIIRFIGVDILRIPGFSN